MCLSPIRIRNRQRHYSADGMQPRWLYVPCGHCAECLALKRRQWYVRNYWQCRECIDKGGFVLFDSLTFREEDLPHIADFLPELLLIDEDNPFPDEFEEYNFPCFDERELKLFFKKLRQRLRRAGYDVNGNLGYFYVTEYGSDDEYIDDRGKIRIATFRPHYHFLWYCLVPGLSPEELAMAIYECWEHGRTDCVHDGNLRRGYMYLHNVFSKSVGRKDDLSLRKVSNYVAKYVTKEPTYKEKVDTRVYEVLSYIFLHHDAFALMRRYGCESFSELEKEFRKHVEKHVGMFHRQSQGFGKYALEFKDVRDSIFDDGVVRIPDEQRVVSDVPVPLYYVRKLYCHLSDALPGHYEWHWTIKGRKYLERRAERSIKLLADRYKDAFLNMSPDDQRFITDNLGQGKPFLLNLEWYDTRFRDLAEYELFRKDRFSPATAPVTTATALKGSDFRLCPGKMYSFITDDDGALWRLSRGKYKRIDDIKWRECEMELYDGCDLSLERLFHDILEEECCYEYVPPEEESRYLISDFCFDMVLDCFKSYFSPVNAKKQQVSDKIERLSRIYAGKKILMDE